MPVHNADIAAIFEEIADLLEIEAANPFRIRAYRNAARVVTEQGREMRSLVEKGEDLTRLPAIGHDLALKITEIVTTGHCGFLDRLHRELPPAVTELLHIPGLGPKRVRALFQELHVQTLADLLEAARQGRIRHLHGFGEITEQHILHAVEARTTKKKRFRTAVARQYAEALAAYLAASPPVARVEIAGSFRRRKETVGDIDLLAVAVNGAAVTARFTAYDEVAEVLAAGDTRASARLRCGLQVDLRVVPSESLGAALHYFTGSKAHNIAVRRLAQEQGLKINEYGVFRGKQRVAGETEEALYAAVGLPYIPPELREDRGEIEAARAGRLPRLVEHADLRGDLHCHTLASDGRHSLREMAEAARQRGLSYLAVTDHASRSGVLHSLDPGALLRQMDEIDRLNAELTDITLLKGAEVEILEDGSLDLPDTLLARLDIVIGAVHSHFALPRAKQTARVLKALDHPTITLLAHPSARLLGEREPIDVDMARIIRHAGERGCFLELDSQPARLDLDDRHCRMAKAEGVLVSIDSDAHSREDFANLDYGIGQARRGWLEKDDVLNTRSLAELRKLLAKTR
ncbi:MAG: DNA polymerase/3'-5' exonuclease PolX [Sulfuricellaceae bacterium]|jgi:DNA polymerase (family 10)